MLLALAASLVNNSGRCRARDAANHYARAFQPSRGYGGNAAKILSLLSQGADPERTATQFLPGSFGNGGAMRIAPIGLAHRHAPLPALEAGVRTALLCTHVHPVGVEGALAQAAAVAALCATPHPAGGAAWTPADGRAVAMQLLSRLAAQLEERGGGEMAGKLAVLQQALAQVRAPAAARSALMTCMRTRWQHHLS